MANATVRTGVATATPQAGIAQFSTPSSHASFSFFVDELGRNPVLRDALQLGDAVAFGFGTSQADIFDVSDSIAFEYTHGRSLADTLTFADAQTFVVGKVANDTATVTDSLATATQYARTLADSITVTETTVRALTMPRTLADSMTLAESLFAGTALNDAFTVTDDLVKSVADVNTDAAAVTDTGSYGVYNYAGADYFAQDYVYASTGSF